MLELDYPISFEGFFRRKLNANKILNGMCYYQVVYRKENTIMILNKVSSISGKNAVYNTIYTTEGSLQADFKGFVELSSEEKAREFLFERMSRLKMRALL